VAYLLGVDEAGYGPNLGPLVITATVWRVPDAIVEQDFYSLLADCVIAPPAQPACGELLIGDSKQLYAQRQSLEHLEAAVLVALRLLDRPASSWSSVWRSLAPGTLNELRSIPWYAKHEEPVPVDCDQQQIETHRGRVAQALDRCGIQLVDVAAHAVFPATWNQLLVELGNKSTVLTNTTIRLVRDCLARLSPGTTRVVCDKHGGRARYADFLQQHFPDFLVEIYGETKAMSCYRWGPREGRIDWRFVQGGESFLPAALASMVSKYLRELAMRAFNNFWVRQLPELVPTAGYPHDARRFRREIEPVQRRLGIADSVLWRNR
jgi:ribonuclease HII